MRRMQARTLIVIVGADFAGLRAAKTLARHRVQIIIIDPKNYHTFQPLLYQVATTMLSPGQIASPIRGMMRLPPGPPASTLDVHLRPPIECRV